MGLNLPGFFICVTAAAAAVSHSYRALQFCSCRRRTAAAGVPVVRRPEYLRQRVAFRSCAFYQLGLWRSREHVRAADVYKYHILYLDEPEYDASAEQCADARNEVYDVFYARDLSRGNE